MSAQFAEETYRHHRTTFPRLHGGTDNAAPYSPLQITGNQTVTQRATLVQRPPDCFALLQRLRLNPSHNVLAEQGLSAGTGIVQLYPALQAEALVASGGAAPGHFEQR